MKSKGQLQNYNSHIYRQNILSLSSLKTNIVSVSNSSYNNLFILLHWENTTAEFTNKKVLNNFSYKVYLSLGDKSY